MSEVPPPDWAALYQKHRDAMYRVAARILREAGRAAEAEDVVMAAMEALMRKPPESVISWEAMLVQATRWRALDLLRSAAVRHASAADVADCAGASSDRVEDDAVEAVDRERDAMALCDKLGILDARHRHVAWEYVAMGRPRVDVAGELGVSPARVSQMATRALKQLREALNVEGVRP